MVKDFSIVCTIDKSIFKALLITHEPNTIHLDSIYKKIIFSATIDNKDFV